MRPAERERGAALLTVLLLVAVVAVLAATALEKLTLSTRLGGNAAATVQARSYAMAAEVLALARIGSLLGQSRDRVTLAGGWSGRPFGLPLPGGGSTTARVTDGGNCFNLNGLVTAAGQGTYTTDTAARVRFARLIRLTGTPAQVAEQIAASAADWIDSDQDQQSQGAEDGAYTGRDPGYRTAGTLMADPGELRAVAGMSPEIYARLKPWICTLPVAATSTLNVNTLTPEQAPLLAMLLPDSVGADRLRQALLQRPAQGYADAGAFWNSSALSGVATTDAQASTGATSTWFALRIDVTLGGAEVQESALVDATRLPARLVSRQWGEEP